MDITEGLNTFGLKFERTETYCHR